ncbi:hypothetical protein [Haladaptatus sp. DJG-WS-42]|uniref:hypothetical protein n=1 Tax=Haladaptatus sp. DJG-WS-42 TaxID=3120516 RepID=UPI0030CE09DD
MPRPARDPDSLFESAVVYPNAFGPEHVEEALDWLADFNREAFTEYVEVTIITERKPWA